MAIFENYPATPGIWDEMYDQGQVRAAYHAVYDFLRQIPLDELNTFHSKPGRGRIVFKNRHGFRCEVA